MEGSTLNAALLPFAVAMLWLLVIYPIKWLIDTFMPDSKFKRMLFKQRRP